MSTRVAFTGHIAGFGTVSGIRMVVGVWRESPFGSFADAMVQTPDGVRTLLAPTAEVAEFISSTYSFDYVVTGEVDAQLAADHLTVRAATVDLSVTVGGPAPLDYLLRFVPGWVATRPAWLTLIDPVASRIVPGVHTAGTAGHGRREFYGVRRTRRIVSASGRYESTPLGGLADLDPPVEFGFSSAPATPQLVSVTTTIEL